MSTADHHVGLHHRHFERLFRDRLDFGECYTGLNVDAAEKYFQIQTDSKGYTIFIVIVIAMKM